MKKSHNEGKIPGKNKQEIVIPPEEAIKLILSKEQNYIATGLKGVILYYKKFKFDNNDENQMQILEIAIQLISSAGEIEIQYGYILLKVIAKNIKNFMPVLDILMPSVDIFIAHIGTFPSQISIFANKALLSMVLSRDIACTVLCKNYIQFIKNIFLNEQISFGIKRGFLNTSFDVISVIFNHDSIPSMLDQRAFLEYMRHFFIFAALIFRSCDELCYKLVLCVRSCIKNSAIYDRIFREEELDLDLNRFVELEVNHQTASLISASLNTLMYYYTRGGDMTYSSFPRIVNLILCDNPEISRNALSACMGMVQGGARSYEVLGEIGLYDNMQHIMQNGTARAKKVVVPIMRSIANKNDPKVLARFMENGLFASLVNYLDANLLPLQITVILETLEKFFAYEVAIGGEFPARDIFISEGGYDELLVMLDHDNECVQSLATSLKETYFND